MAKRRSSPKRSSRKESHRSRSKGGIKSYYKGHYFEDVVEKYFELLGYRVRRNVRIKGFSGAIHEIDILLETGDEQVVVEVKNLKRPVAKEWIMKTHNVAKDIGAHGAFVVSSSGFTRDAINVAKILGVKLLELNDMVRTVEREETVKSLDKYFIPPIYGARKALEYSYKFAAKRLLRRVEEPVKSSLILIPFYEFTGKYRYYEEEGVLFKKVVERYRDIMLLVDAVKGRLAYTEPGQSTVELVDLPKLTDTEIELYRIISEYDEASFSDLAEDTGWNRRKLSRILGSLKNKGMIDYDEETRVYYSLFPLPEELDESARIIIGDNDIKKELPRRKAKIINPKIPANSIKSIIEKLLNAELNATRIIYIPIYKVVLQKVDEDSYRDIYLLATLDEPVLVENI